MLCSPANRFGVGSPMNDKRAPSVPPPATDDDMTSPPAATGNDSTAQNTPEAAPSGQTTRYVDAILLNVRSKPNARAPIVRRLLGGARVRVEIHGGWSKLRAGQWVRTRHLSKTPTRRVSRAEADKAWRNSKYRDSWKPAK